MVDRGASDMLDTSGMVIETKSQIIMALALGAHADMRTVRRWVNDPASVRPLVSKGLEAEAARIGVLARVEAMRAAAEGAR